MILTVAEMLEGLVTSQVANLDSVVLVHAPTIGAMYEGLSHDLLAQSIPAGLDLRVVSGFIHSGGDSQLLSPQIDCMLVTGTGDEIPYTSDYKWHVEDVIAVVEVKKNLFGAELASAIDHSTHVREITREWVRSARDGHSAPLDTSLAERTFQQISGTYFDDLAELSSAEQVLFHTLVMEVVAPVRIVLGYHGFHLARNLRMSYVEALKSRVGVAGFGLGSLPHLILSGRHSVVKASGMPYVGRRMEAGGWPVIFSTSADPMVLLLEIIWSKIEATFGQVSPDLWGQDLKSETLVPLITATVEEGEKSIGWSYGICQATDEELAGDTIAAWAPAFLSEGAYWVVSRLCAGLVVSLKNPDLASALENWKLDPIELMQELLRTGLVSLRGADVRLITQACVCAILPDGSYIAGDDITGRVSRWIAANSKT